MILMSGRTGITDGEKNSKFWYSAVTSAATAGKQQGHHAVMGEETVNPWKDRI